MDLNGKIRRNFSQSNKLTANYNFKVTGEVAEGTLPDGTRFKIDSDKMDLVSRFFFHLNWKGYIYTVKTKGKPNDIRLHWLVLGYTSRPEQIVDHINRDKTDCRVSNLRFATVQQNSCNRNMSKSNTSGYRGVFFAKQVGKYAARIGYKMKAKNIFYSDDPIECAKAYNYASEILHGEYAGYRNPVGEADDGMKRQVHDICSSFFHVS